MKLPIIPAVQALKYGYELANADAWKNTATVTATMTGLLTALASIAASFGWFPREIPPDTILTVATAAVSLITTFLGYLSVATNKFSGVRVKQSSDGLLQHSMDGIKRPLTDTEVRAMRAGVEDDAERIIAETEMGLSAALGGDPAPDRVLPSETNRRARGPLDAH